MTGLRIIPSFFRKVKTCEERHLDGQQILGYVIYESTRFSMCLASLALEAYNMSLCCRLMSPIHLLTLFLVANFVHFCNVHQIMEVLKNKVVLLGIYYPVILYILQGKVSSHNKKSNHFNSLQFQYWHTMERRRMFQSRSTLQCSKTWCDVMLQNAKYPAIIAYFNLLYIMCKP